jgi:uncharacterized membrane protein YphA (DoxX/SURF4 family)
MFNMLIRGAVAAVWLHQGLWCKLLMRAPHHAEIVSRVPFAAARANTFLRMLGAGECVIAVWVLSGLWTWQAAVAQTALLLGMNAGGLVWARRMIPDPAGMVLQNIVLLLLAWTYVT